LINPTDYDPISFLVDLVAMRMMESKKKPTNKKKKEREKRRESEMKQLLAEDCGCGFIVVRHEIGVRMSNSHYQWMEAGPHQLSGCCGQFRTDFLSYEFNFSYCFVSFCIWNIRFPLIPPPPPPPPHPLT